MTGVLPEILIQCRPNIFVLFKKKKQKQKTKKDFDKPYKQYVFGVKNLVLKKYPKISTVVNPGILIQCRRNIFALFKKPNILTSKSWSWVFGVKKHGSYEIPQDFDRCFT